MKSREPHSIAAVVTAALVIALTGLSTLLKKETPVALRPEFKAVLACDNPGSRELTAGYARWMMDEVASDCGSTGLISFERNRSAALDSLLSGAADIVILSPEDSFMVDSTLLSVYADSAMIWVFNDDFRQEAVHFTGWLRNYTGSERHDIIRQRFMEIYDPFSRVSADFISPYDSLIIAEADSLGWDWKLIAALISKESKFKTEAVSQRGARGLMQVMPAQDGLDLSDPSVNIHEGMRLLSALKERYTDAASPEEAMKFTLAAYNAGCGRINDCIAGTKASGRDASRWDNVAETIVEMREAAAADSTGTAESRFDGSETISFVDRVLALYGQYRKICR